MPRPARSVPRSAEPARARHRRAQWRERRRGALGLGRRAVPIATLVALLLAAALFSGAVAAAPGLLVLVSRPLKTYLATADGVAAALATGARRVDLGGIPDTGAAALRALGPGGATAIVAIGPDAVRACLAAPPGLPIVFAQVLDPVASGILSLPDAYGIATEIPPGLVLDRVRRHLPDVRRLGVPHSPARAGAYVAAAIAEAKTRGLEIVPLPAATEKDVPAAWREKRARIDALWFVPVADPVVLAEAARRFLRDGALRDRLPIVAHSAALFREHGAVVSVEIVPEAIGREAAALAARVLRGERPATRVVPPTAASLETYVMRGLADRLGVRALGGEGAKVVP